VRTAAFILIGIQAVILVAVVAMAATTRSDAAGEGMAVAFAILAGAVFVVFALPALIIALVTRQQWLALTLAAVGASVFVAFMAVVA
jgi:hypothetical protein